MRRRLLVGSLLGLVAFGLMAAPASAGGDTFPVLKVAKNKAGPYSEDGATRTMTPGDKRVFFIKVRNINQTGDMYLQGGGGDGEAIFRYFKGTKEITPQVTSLPGKRFHYGVGQTRLIKVKARLTQAADDSFYDATLRVVDVRDPVDTANNFLAINNPEGH